MKVWEILTVGFGFALLWLAIWAVIILGAVWAIVWLLRHLEVIG